MYLTRSLREQARLPHHSGLTLDSSHIQISVGARLAREGGVSAAINVSGL